MRRKMITSRYVRVRVDKTNEEQVFGSLKEAENWCAKVANTFSQTMRFDVITVTEATKSIEVAYGIKSIVVLDNVKVD